MSTLDLRFKRSDRQRTRYQQPRLGAQRHGTKTMALLVQARSPAVAEQTAECRCQTLLPHAELVAQVETQGNDLQAANSKHIRSPSGAAKQHCKIT